MIKPPQDYGIPMLTEVLETAAPAIEELDDIPELTQLAQPEKNATMDAAADANADFAAEIMPNLESNPAQTPASQTASNIEAKQIASYAPAEEEIADTFADTFTAPSSDIPNQWQDEEWALLQDQITERVLAQIMQRIDAQLELRVRDNLADVLQLAVHKLSEEIRTGLQHTLEDIVNDAVKREITQFKFSRK